MTDGRFLACARVACCNTDLVAKFSDPQNVTETKTTKETTISSCEIKFCYLLMMLGLTLLQIHQAPRRVSNKCLPRSLARAAAK